MAGTNIFGMQGGTSGNLQAGFSDFGAAVQSLFSSQAQGIAAEGYDKAAGFQDKAAALARQNETFAEASTRIQTFQTEREINRTIGSQQAGVAAAGFSDSGTALDLMRSSHEQGALAQSLIQTQGAINVAGYEAQATAYDATAAQDRSLADAARKGSEGSMFGSIISGIAGVAQFAMFL